ncbi:uncharacterized protein F4822DRAFT_440129 [Hypoxylon trugodes]|uniref:uncharacterized protein n=1 Tax=Hypoxylon trugodes TaxID=326681 RepID=UPI002192787E|nr:uncharacterized protein F4822DRAFT_440129 [Hypoxylon trugodes]KAI1383883.1 hypothetical protein F4822DRAFT_440129 [Hypoxylon trugodes]
MPQMGTFPMVPHMVNFVATTSAVCFLALVLVGLRIYTRIIMRAGVGWDDWFIMVSMALCIGLLAVEGILCTSGIGYHVDEVRGNEVFLIQMITVHDLIFVFATLMNEFSILSFYERVFSTSRKLRIISRIFNGFFVIWAIVSITELFVVCHPDLSSEGDSCKRGTVLGESSALTVVGDVVVLILPLPSIWKLNAKLHTKVKITALLLLGVFTLAIAILRYTSVLRQDSNDVDFTMRTQDSLGWAGLEPNLGIFCASLPMVQNLFADWKERLTRRLKPMMNPLRNNSGRETRTVRGGTQGASTPLGDRSAQYSWYISSGGDSV